MNVFCFTGNLGKDAEFRYTPEGKPVCSFSVAVKSGYGDRAQTIWVGCALWGKRAEGGLAQYLVKGQAVAVHGELSTREHEGKTHLNVRVNDVTLVGGQSGNTEPHQEYHGGNGAPASQAQPSPDRAASGYAAGGPSHQPPQGFDDFDDDIPF